MPRRDIIQQALSLLDPHARPKLEELVRAIREVNPTARGLGTSEQSKRYALKTRLQNALIHIFADQLTVAPADDEDDDKGDFVLLRHLATGVDACHAKVSALDDEARRWVRWRLDLPVDKEILPRLEPAGRARELRPVAPADLVERGHLALAEYDFDEARACFEQALRSSPTDASAAEGLMTLLVDHLAGDEEALAIEVTLPASTRKNDPVRTLVAIALIRSQGKSSEARARAVDLVAVSSDQRAPEVLADAAHAALDSGELEEAARILARSKDARGDRWDSASQRLAKLRAEARAPQEEALQAALASQPEAHVESMARELTARWPDSKVARNVLAEIASRRAARLAAEALAEADRCEEADDLKGTMLALRTAVGHLTDELRRGSVLSRLRAIEATVAQRRADTLAQDVLRGLPSHQALQLFVGLAPEAALIVRAQSDLPILSLLDDLRPASLNFPSSDSPFADLAA